MLFKVLHFNLLTSSSLDLFHLLTSSFCQSIVKGKKKKTNKPKRNELRSKSVTSKSLIEIVIFGIFLKVRFVFLRISFHWNQSPWSVDLHWTYLVKSINGRMKCHFNEYKILHVDASVCSFFSHWQRLKLNQVLTPEAFTPEGVKSE